MKISNLPLVSVVTPVYNGEKYLAECIESVLGQTYENWEYIIFNNCSTDDTQKIANEYAHKDKRIKVITNDKFLKQIPNWNASMREISADSKYCKVVHADDCIFPECIEKLVARAEEYPSAGIISSYRLFGSKIKETRGKGLHYKTTFMPGREAGKRDMGYGTYLFGSPTTVLYRSDLIRSRKSFYDPTVIHTDVDVCFSILKEADFAFVHQILSYTRIHNETTSTFCDYYHTYSLSDLYFIQTYGDFFLTSEEYKMFLSSTLSYHHHWLVKIMFKGRGREVWQYHKKELAKMGLKIDWFKLAKAFWLELSKIKPVINWMKKKLLPSAGATKESETIKKTIETKQKETILSEG